ncbi:hypothetical protein [Phytoactinopolyspora limicola]|uniref:hypothetical protein n=1 Tax=Phytoactinopolyspora limicola TaxID=2715536 RepID=UPI00140D9CD6|nr:hypothetical protein [Phytoactinopolyspora limicola]
MAPAVVRRRGGPWDGGVENPILARGSLVPRLPMPDGTRMGFSTPTSFGRLVPPGCALSVQLGRRGRAGYFVVRG